MKALEVIGQIDAQGRLVLEHLPLSTDVSGQVRVIVLYPEATPNDPSFEDPDDTPTEEVIASLKQALKEAAAGETITLEEMWKEFEADID